MPAMRTTAIKGKRMANEAAAAAMLGHAPNSGMIRRYSRNRLELATMAAKVVGA